jgi:hypothetical protein
MALAYIMITINQALHDFSNRLGSDEVAPTCRTDLFSCLYVEMTDHDGKEAPSPESEHRKIMNIFGVSAALAIDSHKASVQAVTRFSVKVAEKIYVARCVCILQLLRGNTFP